MKPAAAKVEFSTLRKGSWIEGIEKQPKILQGYFNNKSPLFQDAIALLQNRLEAAYTWKEPLASLKPKQRVLRARIHLRLADFYRRVYKLSLSLSLQTYAARAKKAGKLKLGKLFSLYYGRLLCLNGDLKAGMARLKQALREVPATRKSRVALWMAACNAPGRRFPKSPAFTAAALQADPAAWSDWVLVHHFFKIKPLAKVNTLMPRTALFWSIFQRKPVWGSPRAWRAAYDKEELEEGGVTTELAYHDPGLPWMLSRGHAEAVLALLASAGDKDRYADFWRARAYLLLGDKHKAQRKFAAVVASPPTKIDWAYLLLSDWLSPAHVLAGASAQSLAIGLVGKDAATVSKTLAALKKGSLAEQIESSWVVVKLRNKEGKASFEKLKQLTSGLAAWEKELLKFYQSAAEKKQQGAALVLQLSLQRYLVRRLLLVSSRAALRAGEPYRASRWLERLHAKARPYHIGGMNQASQIALTATAYAAMGRLDVATLFLGKNRKSYPAVTQPWHLLRTLRIYKGIGTYTPPKSN